MAEIDAQYKREQNAKTEEKIICVGLTDDRAKILGDDIIKVENKLERQIKKMIAKRKENGLPVALYDFELQKPYIEYPDGHRDYHLVETGVIKDTAIAEE